MQVHRVNLDLELIKKRYIIPLARLPIKPCTVQCAFISRGEIGLLGELNGHHYGQGNDLDNVSVGYVKYLFFFYFQINCITYELNHVLINAGG